MEEGVNSQVRYVCDTCPYTYRVDRKIVRHVKLERKVVDDVLGGEESWKSMPKTGANCERCVIIGYFMLSSLAMPYLALPASHT